MLEFIRGRLARRAPTEVVIDVGGMGLRLQVPMSTSEALAGFEAGQQVELLTHLQLGASEPHARLFGFAREAERRMFELLTAVKGVGPGMAVRVLSGASVEELREAIVLQDAARLTRVKGIGKKTAERILFDLKEKVAILGDIDPSEPSRPGDVNKAEALTAMAALGYELRDARKAVDKALKRLGEAASPEDIVRQALQEVS